MTQTKMCPNFLISKIPFHIMCMYTTRYLTSIQLDPSKPEWPVPGMDKNQKCHFRWKVERYTVKKGILYYLHKFSDKTIGYERGKVLYYNSFFNTCISSANSLQPYFFEFSKFFTYINLNHYIKNWKKYNISHSFSRELCPSNNWWAAAT